jgi:hypothetical protein
LIDRFVHRGGVIKNLVVPEPQHPETTGFEIARSGAVMLLLFQVLTAIDLDNQLRIKAHKIDNEFVDFHLTAELVTATLAVTKEVPQLLGISLLETKAPGHWLRCCLP